MNVEVHRYTPAIASEWNELVRQARNGLFLFDRGYMDYHADRFEDVSAVAFVDGRPGVALPASLSGALATSHAGLTFGGFVTRSDLRGEVTLACIDAICAALRGWGAAELEVRLLPALLARYPSAEGEYALWRRGLELTRRDLSSALSLTDPLVFNASKKQGIAKARKGGVLVRAGELPAFHALLESVLEERHGVTPVHSLAELQRLVAAFPEHMLVRVAESAGQVLAGALIYRYPNAWHTQYLAASPSGRGIGALDFLIAEMIEEARADGARWFSFGISTVEQGRVLNEGLLWQKESFGARSVTHDVMRGRL